MSGDCNDIFDKLNSIEAYDYYEDKWGYLPNMIKKRLSHFSVSKGNKWFLIVRFETSTCEINDIFLRRVLI